MRTLDQLVERFTITLPDGGVAVPNKFAYGRTSHTGSGAETIDGWFFVGSPGAEAHLSSEVLKPAGYEVERRCRNCQEDFRVPVTADRHGMPSNGRRALETVFCSDACKRRHHEAKEGAYKAAGRALGAMAGRILPSYSQEFPTEATVAEIEGRVYDLEVQTDGLERQVAAHETAVAGLETAVQKVTTVAFLMALATADHERRLAEVEARLAEVELRAAEDRAAADRLIRILEARTAEVTAVALAE